MSAVFVAVIVKISYKFALLEINIIKQTSTAMSVIQSLRTKYAKLVGFIIAISLVGFLLMDAGDNIKKIFTGNDYIAKVNGDEIDPKEYSIRINELETLYATMGNNNLDENTKAQIHTQVLNEMLFEKVVASQMDDLGLTLTKEESKELISGANPHPLVMQFPYFKNPETGQFDPQALMAFEQKKIDTKNPQAAKALEQWDMMKNYIRRQALIQKYSALVSGGIGSPKFLSDIMTKDMNQMANIRYVKVPFTSINDNEVKVTDADLNDYIKKHAAQYRIDDPTRSMDYVAFDIVPSKDDTTAVFSAISNLKNEFATTTDDENFVNRNSEEHFTGGYVSKKTFMSQFADSILNKPVGSVYGPYFENGSYKLTKVLDRTTLPDSVKVRHILVKTKDRGNEVLSDSLAKKKIDSVELAAKSGADFNQLVTVYSDDDGSKKTAGEYEFTLAQRPQLSKEFGDFIFEGAAGGKKVVKVDNDNYSGYHYIEIINQKGMGSVEKLATITKPLFASPETENAIYSKANEFAGRNTTAKAFDETIKKQNLNKLVADNVKVNDFMIPGIGSSREVIRWMYDAKKDDISSVFNLDGRYIIGKLTAIRDKGLMQVDESNRPMLEAQVKAEKKAALIANKYKGQNVDAIAQATALMVQTADSINASSTYLPNLGYEPKVVGYTFFDGFKPNTTSPGIRGNDGVIFMSLVSREVSNAAPDANQVMQQMMMQNMQLKNSVGGMLQQTLLRSADIKYSAKNLY